MGSADFVCAAFFLLCDNFDGTRNVKNHLTNVKKQSVTFAYYGKYDYLCNNCE